MIDPMSPIQIPFFRELAEHPRFFHWNIGQTGAPTVISFRMGNFVVFTEKFKTRSGLYSYKVREFEYGFGTRSESGHLEPEEVQTVLHEFAAAVEMKVVHEQ